MPERDQDQYGTYRCPVCGHRDATQLRRGEAVGLIRCSYCNTSLEVSPRGRDSGRFTVQVASEPAPR